MALFDMTTLINELRRDEGVRNKPYADTVGKLTIGVGRNLTDVGISDGEIALMLQNDISRTVNALDRNLQWWRNLDAVRQRALVNLVFNMGIVTFLTFKNTIAALQAGKWDDAANGIATSKYATQVGPRAVRIAQMIRTGVV